MEVRFAGRSGGPGTEVHRADSGMQPGVGEAVGPDPAPRGAAAPRARRPPRGREIALVAGLFLVYRLGRLAITGHDELAVTNAWWVWDVERTLRLPDEELLQQWALQWPDLLKAANWYYVGVHFPLTAIFLVWGWLRRPPAEYRYARRLISLLTGLALVVHVVMPLAPPRMLSSLGFLDTMAVFGPSAYGDSTTATVANQFAAMPSLHVGWALLIAVVVVRTARTPWRWVTVLHPAITVLVVVATANHYWVDAIAAALLLVLAMAVTPQPYAPSPLAAWWADRRAGRRPAAAGRQAFAMPGAAGLTAGGPVRRETDPRDGADLDEAGSRTRVFAGCPRPRPPAD